MFGFFQSHAQERDEADRNAALDEALNRIAEGQRDAVEKVYQLTASAVYGFILSIVKNNEDYMLSESRKKHFFLN